MTSEGVLAPDASREQIVFSLGKGIPVPGTFSTKEHIFWGSGVVSVLGVKE